MELIFEILKNTPKLYPYFWYRLCHKSNILKYKERYCFIQAQVFWCLVTLCDDANLTIFGQLLSAYRK